MDDNILFFKAHDHECFAINDILHVYEIASGQVVNLDKSGLFFRKNVENADVQNLRNILGMIRTLENDPYIGLPVAFDRSRAYEFRSLVQKVRDKVHQWSNQYVLVSRWKRCSYQSLCPGNFDLYYELLSIA